MSRPTRRSCALITSIWAAMLGGAWIAGCGNDNGLIAEFPGAEDANSDGPTDAYFYFGPEAHVDVGPLPPPPPPPDSGIRDAGGGDTRPPPNDSGADTSVPVDTGVPDTSTPLDTGSPDTGIPRDSGGMCAVNGTACAMGTDCCSTQCSPTTGGMMCCVFGGDGGPRGSATATCTMNSDCCSGSCQMTPTGAMQCCNLTGTFCSVAGDCCSGMCDTTTMRCM